MEFLRNMLENITSINNDEKVISTHIGGALNPEYFSPAYRDFIYKVINNNSLKIVSYYKDGHITDSDIEPEDIKRSDIIIVVFELK